VTDDRNNRSDVGEADLQAPALMDMSPEQVALDVDIRTDVNFCRSQTHCLFVGETAPISARHEGGTV
jgi:hypothetical protein